MLRPASEVTTLWRYTNLLIIIIIIIQPNETFLSFQLVIVTLLHVQAVLRGVTRGSHAWHFELYSGDSTHPGTGRHLYGTSPGT